MGEEFSTLKVMIEFVGRYQLTIYSQFYVLGSDIEAASAYMPTFSFAIEAAFKDG